MEEIFPAGVVDGKVPPASTENTRKEWFMKSDQNESAKKATAQDMAFVVMMATRRKAGQASIKAVQAMWRILLPQLLNFMSVLL